MCAGPVRTGGGAPTNEAGTTPYGRSTRLGCECVPDRFAPGGPAIRRCSYRQACPPRVVGAPSGCECVMGRFAPGAVLLQMKLAPPRTVGAPAPGANACPPGSHRGRCSYKGTWPDLCCRSTLRVRMCDRPVRTGRSGDPAVLLQTNPAAGGYSARVQVEVRPNMGVPTKPRSLRMLSPSRVMRPW